MDIQFIVDAYSRVVYIISYAFKSERKMGLLLDQAQKEAMNGNLHAKESVKKNWHSLLAKPTSFSTRMLLQIDQPTT